MRPFIFLILVCQVLSAGDFHAILVGDTETNIGDQVFLDICKWKRTVKHIAAHLGRPLKMHVFAEEGLFEGEIFPKVESLSFYEDDVVFFYYSGHGQQSSDEWPLMTVTSSGEAKQLSRVAEELIATGPKLVIAIADCCNQWLPDLPDGPLIAVAKGAPGERQHHEFQSLKALFEQQQGLVLATSASPGEPSWTEVIGAKFTNLLLWNLRQELRQLDTSWALIFEKTSAALQGVQHPQYRIFDSVGEAADYLRGLRAKGIVE